jgi:hypothetical protein
MKAIIFAVTGFRVINSTAQITITACAKELMTPIMQNIANREWSETCVNLIAACP